MSRTVRHELALLAICSETGFARIQRVLDAREDFGAFCEPVAQHNRLVSRPWRDFEHRDALALAAIVF